MEQAIEEEACGFCGRTGLRLRNANIGRRMDLKLGKVVPQNLRVCLRDWQRYYRNGRFGLSTDPAVSPKQLAFARKLIDQKMSMRAVARQLDIPTTTLWNNLKTKD
jgi:hypothetical protein